MRCFNTSLVRLAPLTQLPWRHMLALFQYQLGSIGALLCLSCLIRLPAFQYQLGSIGAPRRLGAILHVAQIRLGTFPPAARGYVTVDPR